MGSGKVCELGLELGMPEVQWRYMSPRYPRKIVFLSVVLNANDVNA